MQSPQTTSTSQDTVQIKYYHKGSLRRTTLKRLSFKTLLKRLRESFPDVTFTESLDNHRITFIDDEGDLITMTCDHELKEAFNIAQSMSKILVIFLDYDDGDAISQVQTDHEKALNHRFAMKQKCQQNKIRHQRRMQAFKSRQEANEPWRSKGNARGPHRGGPHRGGPHRGGRRRDWAGRKFRAKFVEDVTIPDAHTLQPLARSTKTWKIGTATGWDEGTTLLFVGGEPMAVEPRTAVPAASPDTTVNVSVDIVAPEVPGRHQSYFRLVAPDGRRFGPKLWVDITIDETAANGADMPNFKVGPNGAELMPFLAWRGIECDSCNHHVEPGTAAFGNREINFDLCNDCFRESQKTVDSMKSGEDASEIDGSATEDAPVIAPIVAQVNVTELPDAGPVCATFVEDVTIPDESTAEVASVVTKTWKLNTSTGWPEGSKLVSKDLGDFEVVSSVDLPVTPAPGNIDVSLDLKVPSTTGRHKASWTMETADGVAFGPTLWIDVNATQSSFVAAMDAATTDGQVNATTATEYPVAEAVPLPPMTKDEQTLVRMGFTIEDVRDALVRHGNITEAVVALLG